MSLSPGLAIGTAYKIEPQAPSYYRISISRSEVEPELQRLKQALEHSRAQLLEIQKKLEARVGAEHSYIIDAHLLMLEDQHFLAEAEQKIREELQTSERAVREAGEGWLSVYRTFDDPFFRERGSDVREVMDRIIANLMELDSAGKADLPDDLILVAPEVTLSVLADYQLERIKGLVLARGGRTAHVTIIARSYRIPVISGIDNVEQLIRTGDRVVVDGFEGNVWVNPSPEAVQEFTLKLSEEKRRSQALVGDQSPCITVDGRRICLYGNTEVGSEVMAGLGLGAEGIGLFRSEYIYMRNKEGPVTEEEQFKIYRDLAKTVQERPAVVRTLDIGNENHPYFCSLTEDVEPVLGLRGIRLSLKHTDIFRAQVRAILRARQFGNLQILLPMISSADEVIQAREIIRGVEEQLAGEEYLAQTSVQIGVMLEVPAAVLSLDAIAKHSDFLAVGTNDLIQYTLAVGRGNEQMSELFDPLHPAILSSLNRIAQVAADMELRTMVCGEMAAQPMMAYILVGMGFQHLSMNPFAIPEIKRVVREIYYSEARETVNRLLELQSVGDVQAFIAKELAHWQGPRRAGGVLEYDSNAIQN